MSDVKTQIERCTSDFLQNITTRLPLSVPADEVAAVEDLRIRWLGKKGHLSQVFEALKSADKTQKPILGKAAHELKQLIECKLQTLKEAADQQVLSEKLTTETLDISLPSGAPSKGSLHPVTLMGQKLIDIFHRHGFGVYDGPELEYEFYNFSALNIPDHHPARDMQDSFFVEHPRPLVLRTHTSNIQIHAMLQSPPPLKLIAPGRVFRVDNDATHTPMFHQLECVVVDKHIHFGHLKGMIQSFTQDIFGRHLNTRFRPSFFPFVEPGAEIDLECALCTPGPQRQGCRICKATGWLEIGGCGMIHPNVFEAVGYDSEIYTGFAFGFGIDRMAMLYYGLKDLRHLFTGDYQNFRHLSSVSLP